MTRYLVTEQDTDTETLLLILLSVLFFVLGRKMPHSWRFTRQVITYGQQDHTHSNFDMDIIVV